MKALKKNSLMIVGLVLGIAGALASFDYHKIIGWAKTHYFNDAEEVFTGTPCQIVVTSISCTAGPAGDGDNRSVFPTRQAAINQDFSMVCYEKIYI